MKTIGLRRLRRILRYEVDTGSLIWVDCSKSWRNGMAAGCDNGNGYIIIKIDGRMYLAHRLIWKIITGKWPIEVDHKNGRKGDNRWANLREATTSQNQFNRGKPRRGSLPKGVWLSPKRTSRKKFGARIIIGGKIDYLGFFETPEEAGAAYTAAAKTRHGEFLCQRQ